MTGSQADLQDYYEQEAQRRLRKAPRGRRLDVRAQFLELLADEGRRSILELGAGPGLDGQAFLSAGHRFVGLDLAHGNGLLAADIGVRVIQASVVALPIRPSSFDAGWSLSTLMHLDASEAARSADEFVDALRPGSPFIIGVWGSESDVTEVDAERIPGSSRPFHLRSLDHNRRLLSKRAELEHAECWEAADGQWDYQVFHLRRPA